MFIPSLEEAKQLSNGYTVVPIAMELFSDQKTSIEILKNLREASGRFFILESVASKENWGRYSFLGYAPTKLITGKNNFIIEHNGATIQSDINDPIIYLRKLLADYRSPRISELPPFTGGLVGCFAYDFVKYVTPGLELKDKDPENFPDFSLMLIDRVIAFDHFKQKIYLIVNISTDDLENNYIQGISTLKDMESLILKYCSAEVRAPKCGEFNAEFSKENFCSMVEKAKHHIREGDIFQVVISNRFVAECQGDLLQTYRILRTKNPSPYMVYLHMDDLEIVCSSPETLVTLRDDILSSYPLAGTKPRGHNDVEDDALSKELLSDSKELAEHDMLVDLARNDLGKISEFGTVKVKEYRTVKRFSHVMHIASQVTGKIRNDKDVFDTITATLPAGTLSGAPKKRACEIISKLENLKRGPYGGAMGYIDFTGNMDLCIGIRMAVRKNNKVFVQAGAGIVADSIPEKEYSEIQNKAQAILLALGNERRD